MEEKRKARASEGKTNGSILIMVGSMEKKEKQEPAKGSLMAVFWLWLGPWRKKISKSQQREV